MSRLVPENIIKVGDRWIHDGKDVTDVPFHWRCEKGHRWRASLATRTSPGDVGCPTCYDEQHPA